MALTERATAVTISDAVSRGFPVNPQTSPEQRPSRKGSTKENYDQPVYGEGLLLGRSACFGGTWRSGARMLYT